MFDRSEIDLFYWLKIFDDDDDDDDNEDDDKLFLWLWFTDEMRLTLFPAGIIVRDPQYCESPTRCKQDLNLCRTWVQASMNEVVQ